MRWYCLMKNLVTRKCANNLQKYGQKDKACKWWWIDDTNQKKKTRICFVATKILNNSQNTTLLTFEGLKALNFIKKKTATHVLFCEISEYFNNISSDGSPPLAASNI